MTRPVNTDDLLAAYSGGDVDAVCRVLKAFLSGDAEDSIKRHVQNFVRKSIKDIVENIEAEKPPNADLAFQLKRKNRRPRTTTCRNRDIALDVQALRDDGEKKVYAIKVLSEKHCIGVDAIEKIYRDNKADAVRTIKACQAAGVREAGIQVETFWRQKLGGDALLLETFLRHERRLLGKPRAFIEGNVKG